MIHPELATGALIGLAVAAGAARLLWSRRQAGRRTALLIALASTAGVLLFLTLFPPATPFARGTLVVATANTPQDVQAGPGERLIALPEAPPLPSSERVPDLATALRRDGRPARLRIVGAGLNERDRAAAGGMAIDFRSPPVPRGLIGLEPPPATAAGSAFAAAGRTSGLTGGTAELLDPAGRRVDARTIGRDGGFTLIGSARAPGLALFTVRLRDPHRAIAAEAAVPIWTVPDPKPKLLVIGAPGPETKYLRRWAADAGIALTSQLEAGGGVRLGDAPVAVTAASLARFDALLIDDRSWQGLGAGGRGAVAGAVANGLGVVVRMTGPASSAARRDWRALGLDVAGGEGLKPIALAPAAVDADALVAQRTPAAADEAGVAAALDDPAPDLGHWDIRTGAQVVPLIRDDAGALLAGWRGRGLGRVAIWAIADSYALVLAGQRERYFQWWSDAVTTVARAQPQFAPELPAIPRVGERATICGVTGQPRVVGPDAQETRLALAGAVSTPGCAAFWPSRDGTHRLIQPMRGGEASRPFHVYSAGALPGIAATEIAGATAALVSASYTTEARRAAGERPGPAWPWFLAWLAVSALLWWLERRGRRV